MDHLKYKNKNVRHFLSTPFIWGIAIPIIITDLCFEIYHRVCFMLYGIPFVKRSRYIKIDRQKLSYLTVMQKFFCMYCGYANGIVHYWAEIGAQTEKYWCGIQHQKDPNFIPPQHHSDFKFTEYNNKKEFEQKYKQKKCKLSTKK